MDADKKGFIKKSIAISCILAVILSAAAYIVWLKLPDIYEHNIISLSENGDVDTASDKLDELKLIKADDIDPELIKRCRYAIAQGMFEIERYGDAQQTFSELGDYKDSAEMIKACMYGEAEQLFESGDYTAASEKFLLLGAYSDSATRQKECLFALAEVSYSQGNYSDAISRLVALGDFPNANERAFEIALELTKDETVALEMVGNGMSAEKMELVIALASVRESLCTNMIDAGFEHSVALRSDGTVVAAGSNKHGQCDVSRWTDIVAVSAGAYFTLGLKSDGTVVAAGSNEFGQCDVSTWKNVKSIAAGDYDSVAVCNDGTVLACGYHDYGDILLLKNVSDIFAGAYQIACILDDGSVVTSNISSATSLKPVGIALTTAMSVNLMSDGTVFSEFKTLPSWENMVYITANSRGIIGLDSELSVKSFFFRDSDEITFECGGSEIKAVAAGGGHYLCLTENGNVLAFGDNSSGQCDVSTWQLW